MTIQKFKSRRKSRLPNRIGLVKFCNGTFHHHQLGVFFLLIFITISSASEIGMTVGFFPSTTSTMTTTKATETLAQTSAAEVRQADGNQLDEKKAATTSLPSHFDNPTPSASKFTLNGQFVASDSVVISTATTATTATTTTTATLIPTPFYDTELQGGSKMTPSTSTLAAIPVESSPTTGGFTQRTSPDSEKTNDINLLRKLQLWSSSRSAKLNLSEEHQSILRIEPRPNTTASSGSSWRLASTTPSPTEMTTKLTTETGIELAETTTTPMPMSLATTMAATTNLRSRAVRPNPIRRVPSIMYPEWLSSGGVYPDDTADNATSVDYFSEGEPLDYNEQLQQQQGQQQPQQPILGFSDPGEAQEENPSRQDSLLSSAFRKRIRISEDGELDMPEREISGPGQTQRSRAGARTGKDYFGTTRSPQDAMFPQVHHVDLDDGLADVISRGRIDSVKYVYFGDKYNDYHKEEIAGRIIQAVGGVVAAIAQVLTVLGAAKCIRKGGSYNTPPVQLHIGFALLISNLLLLLAVHATEPVDVCASVAVILHYLHLVIGCWLLGHTVQTYRTLQRQVNAPNLLSPDAAAAPVPPESFSTAVPFAQRTVTPSNGLPYCTLTWAAPIPFIIASYLVSPDGYETRGYCWMSLEKGMLVSFIVPVFILIGLNTSLVVLSLRHLLALQKLCSTMEPLRSSRSKLTYPSDFPCESDNYCYTCAAAAASVGVEGPLAAATMSRKSSSSGGDLFRFGGGD